MQQFFRFVLTVAALGLSAFLPLRADSNISTELGVTPILGLENGTDNDVNPAVTYTDSGNGYAYAHNGHTNYIADGNSGTAEDTYYYDFNNTFNSSYVGFSLNLNVTPQNYDEVSELDVSFRLDGDGGWFGVNGSRPGGAMGDNTTKLSDTYLVTPDLQVTYNGTDWYDVGNTNDYTTVLENYTESGGNTTPVTFVLTDPVYNIEGIRLVGTNGGTSGSAGGGTKGGFIAVDEETLMGVAPEPSTYALMALSGAALLLLARRRAVRAI